MEAAGGRQATEGSSRGLVGASVQALLSPETSSPATQVGKRAFLGVITGREGPDSYASPSHPEGAAHLEPGHCWAGCEVATLGLFPSMVSLSPEAGPGLGTGAPRGSSHCVLYWG